MDNTSISAETIAIGYIGRGWSPVPVPHKDKGPRLTGWQSLRLTNETVGEHFNGSPMNIGVILGEPSNGLTDIDLDCPEALQLASHFLLPTHSIFGRPSNPASHRLYYQSDLSKVERIQDPAAGVAGKTGTLVELRSGGKKGAQTVFPGSTHKGTGEQIEWVEDGQPARVDGCHLRECVCVLAGACLLARYWPEGARHDASMAFAGGMARAGQPLKKTRYIIKAVCDVAGDDDVADRLNGCDNTYQTFEAGGECTGWARLIELMPPKVGNKVKELLGSEQRGKPELPAREMFVRTAGGETNDAPVVLSHSFDVTEQSKLPEWLNTIDRHYSSIETPKVYMRNGGLCQIMETQPDTVRGVSLKETQHCILRLTKTAQVQAILTRDFYWKKSTRRDVVGVACPALVANAYIQRGGWELPNLTALTQAPTIRPDGSILQAPGYDTDTGIFLALKTGWTVIPDKPSRDDAIAALDFLKMPFAEFPYINEEGRSVALAAVLTGLVRASLRSAPAFAFSASKMGEGKSLQADIISIIATGHGPGMMAYTNDSDEMRKRITALLMSGGTVGCMDNVNGYIESEALCTILTEEAFMDRLLGASRMVRLSTAMTWLATGNHLRAAGDLTTRMLLSELASGEEHPEQRQGFTRNLRVWVPDHRQELVRAALTIIRAYWVAGCPDVGVPVFGRFEEWSEMVRAPLIWAGVADPVDTLRTVQEDDPRRDMLAELLAAWHAVYGSEGVQVQEVVRRVSSVFDEVGCELRGILSSQFAEGGHGTTISPYRVGRYLAQHKLRVEDGLCFCSRKSNGKRLWSVWKKDKTE